MNLRRGLGGAGGNWPRDGECPDPRVVIQEAALYCGCACALMVLNDAGIVVPSQDYLYELAGSIPFSCDSLAKALNEITGHLTWRAAYVGTRDGEDYHDVLGILSQRPWVAQMWEQMNGIGHFVVVENYIGNQLTILDPAPPGTAYRMTETDFSEYWTLGAVYLIEAQ